MPLFSDCFSRADPQVSNETLVKHSTYSKQPEDKTKIPMEWTTVGPVRFVLKLGP